MLLGKKRKNELIERDDIIASLRSTIAEKEKEAAAAAEQLSHAKKQIALLLEQNDSFKSEIEELKASLSQEKNEIGTSFSSIIPIGEKEISTEQKNTPPPYLQSLNDEQLEAVKITEGYVRVIAGAGSGKTRALTNRYVYLVEELGISPSNILCVTFTNKAAAEMKKRIRQMIGDNDLALICTFHGFCVQVLKVDAPRVNFPRSFMILDEEDTESILKRVYAEKGLSSNDFTFKEAREKISEYKYMRADEYISYLTNPDSSQLMKKYEQSNKPLEQIIWGYVYEQRKNFGFDFDDLILITFYIFCHFEDVLTKWQKRLEYIMVDEFQDVSKTQFALCNMIQGYHKNLFVVGDPDQTIYSFRGASVGFILNFDEIYPGTKTIMMTRNYRSSPNIIKVSNDLIDHNASRIKKELIPVKTDDVQTIYNHAKTAIEEAEWIAQRIETFHTAGIDLYKFAILYRAHYVSRPIEDALMKRNLSYTIYSGISFYERKEIKDVLSYLRMLVYQDDISFLRTVNEPRRNIGEKRIDKLKECAKANNCSLYQALQSLLDAGDPLFIRGKGVEYVSVIEKYRATYNQYAMTDLLEAILRDSGYGEMMQTQGEDERLENLAELKQSMVDYEDSVQEEFGLEDYLSKIALLTNIDKEEKKNTIRLMTVHSAKGLEFPYVFVCGLNEGIFPSAKTDTLEKMEEERRLAYVAFTRAETALFLTDAEGKNYDQTIRYPSRFIFNIKKELLSYTKELEETLILAATSQINADERNLQLVERIPDVSEGTIVDHLIFRKGEVVKIDHTNGIYEIKFENGHTRHLTKQGLSKCRIVSTNEQ